MCAAALTHCNVFSSLKRDRQSESESESNSESNSESESKSERERETTKLTLTWKMCFGREPKALHDRRVGRHRDERVSLSKEALQRIKWKQEHERNKGEEAERREGQEMKGADSRSERKEVLLHCKSSATVLLGLDFVSFVLKNGKLLLVWSYDAR